MSIATTTRIMWGVCALLWPLTGIATLPLVSVVLAALLAYDGPTQTTALAGLAITLGGVLMAGLPLASQALPWLVVVLVVLALQSFIVLTSRGIVRSWIVGLGIMGMIELGTAIGVALAAGSLVARIGIVLAWHRSVAGAVALVLVIGMLRLADRSRL